MALAFLKPQVPGCGLSVPQRGTWFDIPIADTRSPCREQAVTQIPAQRWQKLPRDSILEPWSALAMLSGDEDKVLNGDENRTLSADENKPTKKSGQRKAKTGQEAKKAEPRKRKSAQRQDPLPDQLPEAAETISAHETAETITAPEAAETITAPEAAGTIAVLEAVETITAEVMPAGNTPVDTAPAVSAPVAAAHADTVNYQTIANAYGKYARESLDRTKSFFEKFAGVQSLDKAFELQSEFAKQAYDGFVMESQKLRELHGQLARQRLQHWEGFFARMLKPL